MRKATNGYDFILITHHDGYFIWIISSYDVIVIGIAILDTVDKFSMRFSIQ